MGQVGPRRRRRWPLVLLVVLVVLVAGLVAGDFAARAATEGAIATDVQRSTGSDGASVSISSFPFLYDVGGRGRLDRVAVTDRGVPAGRIRLDQVTLVASQVSFDRRQLLYHRQVRLTSVGSATVTVVAHVSALAGAVARDLGVQVTANGSSQVTVTVGGYTVATIDLTKVALIPNCPLHVTHTGDTYTFGCTVSPVPASVLAALSKARQL